MYQEGVYVHGLFLEGCGWERRQLRLMESPIKVLFTVMPVTHIYAINSTAPKDPKLYMVSFVYVRKTYSYLSLRITRTSVNFNFDPLILFL